MNTQAAFQCSGVTILNCLAYLCLHNHIWIPLWHAYRIQNFYMACPVHRSWSPSHITCPQSLWCTCSWSHRQSSGTFRHSDRFRPGGIRRYPRNNSCLPSLQILCRFDECMALAVLEIHVQKLQVHRARIWKKLLAMILNSLPCLYYLTSWNQKVVCQPDKEIMRLACPPQKLPVTGKRTDSYF
jgi:hypothetical protein